MFCYFIFLLRCYESYGPSAIFFLQSSEMKKGWEDSTTNNFITKLELRFILIILFIKLSVNQPKKMH
ncbi:hypothetical protein MKX03_026551 [Papaver bracteatum]|nr:hypothetical protein MKX03_026551 [Papaver bracteatum]